MRTMRREGKVERAFEGQSVLVTGAGGSIGSQLCEHMMSNNARKLILVSLTESALYRVEKRLSKMYKYRDTVVVPVLGSYGDADLMCEHLKGVDVVVHAGAHKHVPLCEKNPIAAITNNVIATQTLMHEAACADVKQFCVISTDKAVKPASIMGATKRAVELSAMSFGQRWPDTRFFVVRFGNVIDSDGSVIPLWRDQVEAGGPVTLTDERCERFFMTIADAVDMIARVVKMGPDGGIFVLDMGKPRKLIDIANEMIRKSCREIDVQIIGLRPGEKVTEELHYGGELVPTSIPKVFIVEDPGVFNADTMYKIESACAGRDRDAAVKHLWELVS